VSPTSPTSSVLRPRLRGVADIYVASVAVPAVIALVLYARDGAATLSALVYGTSLVVLLVGSAVYHLPGWPLRTALWLRKLDHANIYLLIAGTATPLALALDSSASVWLLSAMWLAAGLGVVKTFAWPRAPRKLSAALYVLMGCFTLPAAPALRSAADEVF
jgi:hemolysin III